MHPIQSIHAKAIKILEARKNKPIKPDPGRFTADCIEAGICPHCGCLLDNKSHYDEIADIWHLGYECPNCEREFKRIEETHY